MFFLKFRAGQFRPYGGCSRYVFSRLPKFRGPVIPTLPEGPLPLYCPLVLGGREACLGGGPFALHFSCTPRPFTPLPFRGGLGRGSFPRSPTARVHSHRTRALIRAQCAKAHTPIGRCCRPFHPLYKHVYTPQNSPTGHSGAYFMFAFFIKIH